MRFGESQFKNLGDEILLMPSSDLMDRIRSSEFLGFHLSDTVRLTAGGPARRTVSNRCELRNGLIR